MGEYEEHNYPKRKRSEGGCLEVIKAINPIVAAIIGAVAMIIVAQIQVPDGSGGSAKLGDQIVVIVQNFLNPSPPTIMIVTATPQNTPFVVPATPEIATVVAGTLTAMFTPVLPTQGITNPTFTSPPTVLPTISTPISIPTPIVPLGITECELQVLVNNAVSSDSDLQRQVARLIQDLDIYWGRDPRKGGDWLRDDAMQGVTIEGAAVFWTNLFEHVSDLPNDTEHLLTYQGWGVFITSSGATYTIPADSEGGRFLRVVAGGC